MTGTALVAIAAIAALAMGAPGTNTAARAAPGAEAPAPHPNILFILIDDMGYADLSVTGNRRVATPNIDRLASEGLLISQFYDAAPICSPSRAAFMTGRFPARDRFVNFINDRAQNAATGQADWLDPKLPMLPRALKQAGYATGHFGKWHMGGGRDVGDAPLPAAYGFDESYTQFEGLGPRVLMTEDDYKLASKSIALGKGPIDRLPKAETTGRFVDKALDFIGRHKTAPWFVDLWPDDVHDPWTPNEAQLAAVKGKGRNADENRFFATLVAMDKEIGRLINTLRANGQLDNTIVILTSDNGPTAARGYYRKDGFAPGDAGIFRGRKGSLYEGGIRQPMIIRWPGHVNAGSRDNITVTQAVDLFPTLARIAGAAAPARGDGISVFPAWTGAPIASRPDILWAYGGFGPPNQSPRPSQPRDLSPTFAIRAGAWKLLARGDGANAQLFDIVRDPGETRNLAADQPAVVKSLTQRLVAWRKSLPLTPFYLTRGQPQSGPGGEE